MALPAFGRAFLSLAAAPAACPCASGKQYADCCGRFHAGSAAPTAEALMRSRYSAYVRADEAYLLATWHASTRPAQLDLAADADTRWLGLAIKRHAATGADQAVVEFVARYKIGGRAHRLHEVSRFVREDGRWYYVDGEFPATGGRP
jgi:SEC-C motif domain protein